MHQPAIFAGLSKWCLARLSCVLLSQSSIGLCVPAPQPIDLPEMPLRFSLVNSQLAFPFHGLIRAEHTIPKIRGHAEIVMPLVMRVMDEMHRSRHPKAFLWILVLQLMSERGHQTKGIRADHPA